MFKTVFFRAKKYLYLHESIKKQKKKNRRKEKLVISYHRRDCVISLNCTKQIKTKAKFNIFSTAGKNIHF